MAYQGYPAKSSSPPSPLSATVTRERASCDRYQTGSAEESPNGSPKCSARSGSTPAASGFTTNSSCSVLKSSATRRA